MKETNQAKSSNFLTNIKYKLFGTIYLMLLLALAGIIFEQFGLLLSWWRVFLYGFTLLAFVFLMINDPKSKREKNPKDAIIHLE